MLGDAKKNVDAISQDDADVKQLVKQDTGALKSFRSALNTLSDNYKSLESGAAQLEARQQTLSNLANEIGKVVSSRLAIPLISGCANCSSQGLWQITGFGFGSTKGQVYVKPWDASLPPTADLTTDPKAINATPQVEDWTSTTITMRQNEMQLMLRGHNPQTEVLLMQIVTESNIKSLVLRTIPYHPHPPILPAPSPAQ